MKTPLRFVGNTPSHRLSYDSVAVDRDGNFYKKLACDPDFDHPYKAVAECPALDRNDQASDTFYDEEVEP
jgi:hypothetical protein